MSEVTPKDILFSMNTVLAEYENVFREPEITRVAKNERERLLTRADKKRIGEADMTIGLAGEVLFSTGYKTCIPIILRDNLNGYGALIHFYAGELVARSEFNVVHKLKELPWGSLTMLVLSNDASYDKQGVIDGIKQCRPDIISVKDIPVPDVNRAYYDVAYDIENDATYVHSIHTPEVMKITGLDYKIGQKIPQYENLKWYFTRRIEDTFFL